MENYVAVIGDIVQSRALSSKQREDVQLVFASVLQAVNARYAKSIASRFIITVGDEFQGLLVDASVVPDLIWELEDAMAQIEFRIGIGYGSLTTGLQLDAIGMDGPSFHTAREAIVVAKRAKKLGGVFVGFGATEDHILNGYARILWYHRRQWTSAQREVAKQLRSGRKQAQIRDVLGITQQAVSSRVRSAGWDAYHEAEQGWKEALGKFDDNQRHRR